MKITRLFNVLNRHTSNKDEQFIILEEFIDFIKKKDSVKIANVKRTLNSYKGGIQTIDGVNVIPTASIIRFCFNNADNISACGYLCNIIESELFESIPLNNTKTTLVLYKTIAETNFTNLALTSSYVNYDEISADTLLTEYKLNFNQENWSKIVWFEKHFSQSEHFSDQTYDETLSKKWEKFNSLVSLKKVCEHWSKAIKYDIAFKAKRQSLASKSSQVEIVLHERHNPTIIEGDIYQLFQIFLGDTVDYIVCYDTLYSKEKNILSCVVILSSNIIECEFTDDLCQRAYFYVLKKHKITLNQIRFTARDYINQYIEGDHICRFQIRDDIEADRFKNIFYNWNPHADIIDDLNSEYSSGNEPNICKVCFDEETVLPLSVHNFKTFEEWFISVPAETQLLLEVFINKSSLIKSKSNEDFLKKKIERIYTIYDTLLHIYNKNFFGIFQQTNTNELLIEYKNIKSVFGVTTASGSTTSLTHAETSLTKQNDSDLLYYNTYLKNHLLQYISVTDTLNKRVCLRDCHVILMLDNLVRLKYVADPNPSDSRTKQLCTLPITLQGLPKDAKITSLWHLEDCTGENNCKCKHAIQLTKDDIGETLLNLKKDEEADHNQFSKFMVWGNGKSLWKKLADEVFEDRSHKITVPDAEILLQEETVESEGADTCPFDKQSSKEESCTEDENLTKVLESLFDNGETEEATGHESSMLHDQGELSDLEVSFDNLSIIEGESIDECYTEQSALSIERVEEKVDTKLLLSSFGFSKYIVPPLLCRHPPPASGRDDDIHKIKEILDDTFKKMGYEVDPSKQINRILCGPDNKIGKSILTLMTMDEKYQSFLPEFPLLHLRKSMITILFSAYKDAGLVELLKFMKGDNDEDWRKLVSIDHINTATRYVKRIVLSLHLAFIVTFYKSLERDEKEVFLMDMETLSSQELSENWSRKFEKFLSFGSSQNATFALHYDIMKHCNSIIEVALSERLGGTTGYSLLLAAVKNSLKFSFVNNASSYGPYCVKLLYEHYRAGHFHMCLKQILYTTPFKGSKCNYACDTKRELDHLDAIKGFRSGSSLNSVTCRMSLLDTLAESRRTEHVNSREDDDTLGLDITEVDQKHIIPTVELILRQNALSTEPSIIPYNVYTKIPIMLPCSILDDNREEVGEYLIRRFLVKESMFQLKPKDLPSSDTVIGAADLVKRAKNSKGTTIRRTIKSKIVVAKTESQIQEEQRKIIVSKETRIIDCMYSSNNACQAIVKPDSTKPKVMKAIGMQKALNTLLHSIIPVEDETRTQLIMTNRPCIPTNIAAKVSLATVEFAGVKFKLGNIKSGPEYIQHVQKVLDIMIEPMTKLKTLVIAEEKYQFTPDDFKAATREQRSSKYSRTSVDHLKEGKELINETTFNKEAISKTLQGKTAIGTYLASHLDQLNFANNFSLIVDSELNTESCNCSLPCKCLKNTTPIKLNCSKPTQNSVELMTNIQQRKGEAEMAIADWFVHFQSDVPSNEIVLSIITSGDIDAVPIHLYTCSKYGKRNENKQLETQIFVALQKPRGKFDIYNISGLVSLFEKFFGDMLIGQKIAFVLCMGGNDFIPKLHSFSHDKLLSAFVSKNNWIENLFCFDNDKATLNINIYKDLVKYLYCPKKANILSVTYGEIRAITIGKKSDKTEKGGYTTTNPRKWLPPETSIERLGQIIQLQILYLETIGLHSAPCPDFLSFDCLKKNASGEIVYAFGPESHFGSMEELPFYTRVSQTENNDQTKRKHDSTPQKGRRRKRIITSTPTSRKK